jgi:hypothetical protein
MSGGLASLRSHHSVVGAASARRENGRSSYPSLPRRLRDGISDALQAPRLRQGYGEVSPER